ncbi:rab GTPase-activating protein 1-like [Watersipora subatra]|uniref:rab GTPase-activating protein 1-like n=1 Tax=Watersipora subatra TaxID=2589382 RepID=UPI00355C3F96
MANLGPNDEVIDDAASTSSSTSSEYCIVSNPNTPRRSSVNSDQIAADMSELLAGLTDPSTEDWEFDQQSDSASDGRSTPILDEDGRVLSQSESEEEMGNQSGDANVASDDSYLKAISRSEPNINQSVIGQSATEASIGHAHSMTNVQPVAKSDQEFTVFDGVTYLGAAAVNAPRSEAEIIRNMTILNDHNTMAMPIKLMIPSTVEGDVRLVDRNSESEIGSFKIPRILFCTRGAIESAERNCFAFTSSHGDNAESTMFQCHVFRCDLSDAVGKILFCFKQLFSKFTRKLSNSVLTSSTDKYIDNLFTFEVTLEIKEEDSKGGFSSCPVDNGAFKLRCDLVKSLTVTLVQTSNRELRAERCFGMLVSPGRNIKNSDMHLIEMTSMGYDHSFRSYSVNGQWDPAIDHFEVLNDETPKDMRVFMTIAVDLVFVGIREPVRFTMEARARIFPKNERFWYFSKKQAKESFFMHLKPAKLSEEDSQHITEQQFELESLMSATARERKKSLTLAFSKTNAYIDGIKTPTNEDEESDDESPMVSGSGHVTKDITDEELVKDWDETLKKWNANLATRPKLVPALCKRGIPEALRGAVWQLLAGCQHSEELVEAYRILIAKDSPVQDIILRDMHRTFPAHDYFKDVGGVGQDVLYKLNKAYSVYDAEVGYCQGLSFLVAALLLHMPEEQAFAVLVKIMFDYQLRNFYKDGFHDLQLRFYQLERLLQHQVPDLYSHMLDMQLEAHMYASQWFLSLFTAKFPLYLVYRIIDLFLCNGINTIFNVAIALLKDSRRELLALDFEGVLKFFRVTLPKKYRAETAANHLLDIANRTKIQSRKLQKYEQEYLAIQAAQMKQEDPVDMFKRENKRLIETNMRLEQENDGLAHELVTSKVTLRSDLDSAEDSVEDLSKRLEITTRAKLEADEVVKRLSVENSHLKEKYRTEVCTVEDKLKKSNEIIDQYKDICNKMSDRNEKATSMLKGDLETCKDIIGRCADCSKALKKAAENGPAPKPPIDQSVASKDKKIRELELELARTKLALVQVECRSQEMSHELTATQTELQTIKNSWWNKKISPFR